VLVNEEIMNVCGIRKHQWLNVTECRGTRKAVPVRNTILICGRVFTSLCNVVAGAGPKLSESRLILCLGELVFMNSLEPAFSDRPPRLWLAPSDRAIPNIEHLDERGRYHVLHLQSSHANRQNLEIDHSRTPGA